MGQKLKIPFSIYAWKLLCCLFLVFTFQTSYAQEKNNLLSKNYCTEIGRFDMLIDNDEVAGAYYLIHKNALGGVWGKLSGNVMKGRWHDADGKGNIIITFSDDFSFFTADYCSDAEPEKWYKDSWHGSLRPDESASSFESNNKTYQCE